MKNVRLIILGVLTICLVALAVTLTNTVLAAPSYSPLFADPTPTPEPDWYWTLVAESTATHDGEIGEVYGNKVDVDGYPDAEAIVVYYEKWCPGSPHNHWAKTRKNPNGGGWVTAGQTQTCGYTTYYWEKQNNAQTYADTKVEVIAQFPMLGDTGTYNTNALSPVEWQAYTGAGTGGDAGYQSKLIVWYLAHGSGVECTHIVPEEREALSTGILIGTDEVGEVFDLTEGQEYLLYTEDGPWNDGVDDRYDAGVRFFDGADWGDWAALENVEGDNICDESFLDANGSALFFTAEADQTQIQFRVNDTDDNFGDNTGDLAYYWIGGEGSGQSCAGNWTKGDLVGSATVDATDCSYQYLQPDYIINGLYSLTVTGTYDDNGVDANDVRIANFPASASENHQNYLDSNVWTGSATCSVETDTLNEYYGQSRYTFYDPASTYGFGKAKPLSVVNDGSCADNSGTISVAVHEAGYVAPAADCSARFEEGPYIETPVIWADMSGGASIPYTINGLTVGQWYYLEQVNGYIQDGDLAYTFEMRESGTGSWLDADVVADCVNPLTDVLNGYFFQADYTHYDIRAETGIGAGYDDNDGSLTFNLHGIIDNEVPDGENCSDYLDVDTLAWRGSVAADSTAGTAIDYSVFTAGEDYLIKIVAPVYTDPGGSGKTGEMRRAAPGIGSVSYESFDDWGGSVCYEQVDGYDYVYFNAVTLSDYEVRATTPGDNSGTLSYEVYEVTRIQESQEGCELRDYGDVDYWYTAIGGDVMANSSGEGGTGFLLANELDLVRYKFETSGGPWTSSTPPPYSGYDLEISADSGGSWTDLDEWLTCVVVVGEHIRGYIDSPAGGPFTMRANDTSDIWLNNSGSIHIEVWTEENIDYPLAWELDGWGEGCTAYCVQPGWLEIGQWVEFARCRITHWLSWCPQHTEAIRNMQSEFYDIEPFGTILEMVDLGRAVQAEVNSYTWVDDSGGGEDPEIQSPENFIFAPGEGGGADIPIVGPDSIWGSGDIDLQPAEGLSYSTACDNLLAESLGTRLSQSMCFAFNVVDGLGLKSWFQWIWDMAMVTALMYYVKKNWVDRMQG